MFQHKEMRYADDGSEVYLMFTMQADDEFHVEVLLTLEMTSARSISTSMG